MSYEHALSFGQWKALLENYKPMRIDYELLFTNLPRIIAAGDFSPSSLKLRRGTLPLLTK